MKKILNVIIILSITFILFGCKRKQYEINNKTLYFGYYPQSLEVDENILSSLNKKVSNLPSSNNLNGWTDYNYYIDGSIQSFMYYIDIDLDNNGSNDYRGVYFNEYRPYNALATTDIDESFQDDNGYDINNVYFFKYERIKWDILENNDGSIFAVTNIIIDSQDYYPDFRIDDFSHNDGVGRVNNYKLSNIRKWLNNEFYNTAFSDKEKEIILTTEVDNSKESTNRLDNPYTCENTFDKVFLLSYAEAMKYYPTLEDKMKKGTDYAKCQGLNVANNDYSHWRLRSPYTNFVGYDTLFNHKGQLFNKPVANTSYGIRPALYIKK